MSRSVLPIHWSKISDSEVIMLLISGTSYIIDMEFIASNVLNIKMRIDLRLQHFYFRLFEHDFTLVGF